MTTAILNFYLPLLVLISLNGRIYYEIKRRYKNVLLQRHSTKISESPSNYKLSPTRKNSHLPMTMTLCESERSMNFTENDSLIMARNFANRKSNNDSKLRINFKEKKKSTDYTYTNN